MAEGARHALERGAPEGRIVGHAAIIGSQRPASYTAAVDSGDRPASLPSLRAAWRGGARSPGARELPVETPVALVHDGSTYAVMMATSEVARCEVAHGPLGSQARLWLAPDRGRALAGRRRRLAGPTGCGLCGIESLEEAARAPSPVAGGGLRLAPAQVLDAMAALSDAQALGAATRAVHAAGFWTPAEGLVAVREDVGRHNALDKLVGALARAGRDASDGAVLLTSRVSVEMVTKAAAAGAPVLVAVSAPTTLALATAQAAGVTLVAVARADGFEVFCGEERIAWP